MPGRVEAALVAILLHDGTTGELHVDGHRAAVPSLDQVGYRWPTPFGRSSPPAATILVDNLDAAAIWPSVVPQGPAFAAPLAMTGTVRCARRRPARLAASAKHSDSDVSMITTFAAQAALSGTRTGTGGTTAAGGPGRSERIARDLHDVVIRDCLRPASDCRG